MRGITREVTDMLPECRYKCMCHEIGDVKIDIAVCGAVYVCTGKEDLLQRYGSV